MDATAVELGLADELAYSNARLRIPDDMSIDWAFTATVTACYAEILASEDWTGDKSSPDASQPYPLDSLLDRIGELCD